MSEMLVMEIVDVGQGLGGAPQLGMVGDIGDPLAIDPDFTATAKPLQELLARPCRHALSPDLTQCRPYLARQNFRRYQAG